MPHERRVIEIPRAASEANARRGGKNCRAVAPVTGIRLENTAEMRIGRLIGVVMVVGIIAASGGELLSRFNQRKET